jgi:hypothetical protein
MHAEFADASLTDPTAFRKVAIGPIDCLARSGDIVAPQYWLLTGICAVATILIGYGSVFIMGPMYFGMYLCFLNRMRGERVKFDTAFEGLKIYLPGLLIGLAHVGLMLPTVFLAMGGFFIFLLPHVSAGGEPPVGPLIAAIAVASFIATIGPFIVSVLFFFAYPLAIDRGLRAGEAIAVSVRAGMAHFGGVAALIIFGVLLQGVGLLFCLIGYYFILPITFCSRAVAYRKVFPDLRAPAAPFPDSSAPADPATI